MRAPFFETQCVVARRNSDKTSRARHLVLCDEGSARGQTGSPTDVCTALSPDVF